MSMLKIELFKGKSGKWYFRPIARNGVIVAASQGYASKWNAKRAAIRLFPDIPVSDQETDD